MEADSVSINDANFCQDHLREVCEDCEADFREENDSFYGFDTVDRGAIICPAAFQDGDGVYKCQKHGSYTGSVCFAWKKQITKLRATVRNTD